MDSLDGQRRLPAIACGALFGTAARRCPYCDTSEHFLSDVDWRECSYSYRVRANRRIRKLGGYSNVANSTTPLRTKIPDWLQSTL